MKIYTKTGDKGTTALLSGKRVSKNHPRISTYGQLDTLNSQIGVLLSFFHFINDDLLDAEQKALLDSQKSLCTELQIELFNLGSYLSCDKASFLKKLPALSQNLVAQMEKEIDQMTAQLSPLKNFILPGGHPTAAQAHMARTLSRDCERQIIALNPTLKEQNETLLADDLLFYSITFLNRLSDYFFTFSRFLNQVTHSKETLWK